MTQNIDAVLTQRGNQYGSFEGHAHITQDIKHAMKSGVSWQSLTDSQKEALEMVAHKIGRICNGNPNYKDSWTDIIGYTRLVEKDLPEPAAGNVAGNVVTVSMILPETK